MPDTEEIKALNRKRGIVRRRLTLFSAYVNNLLDRSLSKKDLSELKIRYSKFEPVYEEFNSIQSEIEELHDPSEPTAVFDEERSQFEEDYFKLCTQVQELIDSCDNDNNSNEDISQYKETMSSCDPHASGTNIKLPTISLPMFDGNYEKWLEYRDTFNSLINKNKSLPDITKYHYLRSSITGSAVQAIASIDFSADNYTAAWQMLCNRFDNKTKLINNHLKALFNFDTIKKESYKSLQALSDHISKHLNCLNNLGEPTDKWDTLIVFMFANKLDPVTGKKWEECKKKLSSMPSLEDFLKFVRERADIVEAWQNKTDSEVNKSVYVKKPERPQSKFVATLSDTNVRREQCPVCSAEHRIYQCPNFVAMSPEARNSEVSKLKLCINCLRSGHHAAHCTLGPCRVCRYRHNTMLHVDKTHKQVQQEQVKTTQKGQETTSNPVALSSNLDGQVLLSTALVNIVDKDNNQLLTARALLDCGSQSSFITQGFVTKYKLSMQDAKPIQVSGINNMQFQCTKRCDITVKACVNNTFSTKVNCIVLPRITQDLPSKRVNVDALNIPQNLKLADPTFSLPSEIDILLGSDVFWDIIESTQLSLGKGLPTLQNSKLGWLVVGPIGTSKNHPVENVYCNFSSDIDTQLRKFWETEEIPTKSLLSREEEECEQHFVDNTKRLENGKFCVTLPLKASPEVLGESYSICKKQLENIERRFDRQPEVYQMYKDFLSEYESLGHLSVIDKPEKGNYLPHHPVIRKDSNTTPLRVVFNAAQKTSSGLSLNDILKVGPTVQDDLFSILIRFREHRFVFTGDIEKMYRQIEVNPEQRHLQLILWRERDEVCDNTTPSHQSKDKPPPKCLQLNTVTYGTSSAPYLSTRCLVQLARECKDEEASRVIEHDFYVDDLLTGSGDESTLQHIYDTVTSTLGSAGFNLRKIKSNSPNLCNSETQKTFQLNENFKTLGLKWHPLLDELGFSENTMDNDKQICKRSILSASSRIFDPLGMLSGYTILFKMLLQQLWMKGINWDDEVPHDIKHQWMELEKGMTQLCNIKIPRHVMCIQPVNVQIHTFSDASMKAYGACVYVRSTDSCGNVKTQLLCAKTRVAPVKPTTIPRLELCAALLGANLSQKVRSALRCKVQEFIFWSDSKIVLCWLKMPPSKLKVYVANRIASIKEIDNKAEWKYVPSASNPADLASRGVQLEHLKDSPLWWEGPEFLKDDRHAWPSQHVHETPDLPEIKAATAHVETQPEVVDFSRFSKFTRLQRTLAYVNRFMHNCRHPNDKLKGNLSVEELALALTRLVKLSQMESFNDDVTRLSRREKLKSSSPLLSLTPYIDENGLLRVGGRLENSNYDYSKKHPIILSSKHHLCKLLFEHEHRRLLHAGPQLLLASIREEYWPIGGRVLAKTVYRHCVTCRRVKGQLASQIMGNLPKDRITPGFPFEIVSTDYAGPFFIASKKGRGCRIIKSYLCIFVCFKTKAVHLEQVSDLTTQMYILTLKRFIARRGKPHIIYSDNGSNYVGASREIGRFLKENCDSVSDSMASEGIRFKFSPAYSPHHGGLHEAAVKSAKFHIKRTMGNTHLTFEELSTLFAQIEAILNSRPLSPLSSDPDDYSCLTPGHFLIGRPLTALPSPPLENENPTKLQRYQRIEQIRQQFWARWKRDYLAELQQKSRWRTEKPSLQPGQLVMVKEEGVPPMMWRLARVHRLLPGSDGRARMAELRTHKGIILRAYDCIAPLPVLDSGARAS